MRQHSPSRLKQEPGTHGLTNCMGRRPCGAGSGEPGVSALPAARSPACLARAAPALRVAVSHALRRGCGWASAIQGQGQPPPFAGGRKAPRTGLSLALLMSHAYPSANPCGLRVQTLCWAPPTPVLPSCDWTQQGPGKWRHRAGPGWWWAGFSRASPGGSLLSLLAEERKWRCVGLRFLRESPLGSGFASHSSGNLGMPALCSSLASVTAAG